MEARGHLSLAEVGTEEFLQKLTSQITEIVSAKITQGESTAGRAPGTALCLVHMPWAPVGRGPGCRPFPGIMCPVSPSQAAGARRGQ